MKQYCRGSYSILFVVATTVFLTVSSPAYAAMPLLLPTPTLSQHLRFADSNGDTGYFDCAIAADAIALQTLVSEGKIPLSKDAVSYATIRLSTRNQYVNISKGITLREAAAMISSVTNNALGAAFVKIDARHWDEELFRQLHAGYPVIVHISDWSYLDGHEGQGKSAHAIVVSGMDEQSIYYVDPWDGRMHAMTHDAFALAWAQGHYNWSAMVFIEKKPPTNFTDIMRLLITKHAA